VKTGLVFLAGFFLGIFLLLAGCLGRIFMPRQEEVGKKDCQAGLHNSFCVRFELLATQSASREALPSWRQDMPSRTKGLGIHLYQVTLPILTLTTPSGGLYRSHFAGHSTCYCLLDQRFREFGRGGSAGTEWV